ncbi:MAG: sulfate reduction electron transfer complex DsrMKJOP subunit DsrJ [Desulfosarcina sp.]
MKDQKKIIVGLVVFIALVTFPFWFNLGRAVPAPELELTAMAKAAEVCVMSTAYMSTEHMHLLDVWRHNVVRNGERVFINPDGKRFSMSLSNTCLDCHSNKAAFCDRCHDYVSARPHCWDCHIDNPKGE